MSDKTCKRWVVLVFITGLGLRALWVYIVPLWQQADEYPHFHYIQHIYHHQKPPVSKPIFPYYEGYQPPMYYLCSAGVFTLFSGLDTHRNEMGGDVQLDWKSSGFQNSNPLARLLRWLSIVFWAGTFWADYLFLSKILNGKNEAVLVGVSLMAFLPTYVSNSSAITNDGLVVFLCSIFVLGLVTLNFRKFWHLFSLGIILGWAILTKYNSLVLIPALILFVWQYQRQKFAKSHGVILGVATALVVPWIMHTSNLYGAPLSVNPGVEMSSSLTLTNSLQALKNLFWSFWAAAGRVYEIHLPVWYYLLIFGGLTMLAGLGWLGGQVRREEGILVDGSVVGLFRWMFLILAVLVIASIGYTLAYKTMTSWGKNLYVWLLPISALMGVGWAQFSSGRYWVALFPLILFTTNLVYLFGCVIPYFHG